MDEDEILRSQLRLFLSVDVSGSTRLKGRLNYSALLQKLKNGDPHNTVSREDFDWEMVQMSLFNEFHAEMMRGFPEEEQLVYPAEMYPWKALGDELIYSFEVQGMAQLRTLLAHFLRTLRWHDSKEGAALRLTGTAWLAGFPVRNRVVSLPGPDLQTKSGEFFPYPRRDYWGPDMDIGFRLGKHSHPGMCVASVSLVELCAREGDSRDQVKFAHVGWEKLKGVFDDIPYPIFWADFPEAVGGPAPKIPPWAVGETPYIESWERGSQPAGKHASLCSEIRKALDPRFLPAQPYIPGVHETPEDDDRIVECLRSLSKGAAEGQFLESYEESSQEVAIPDMRTLAAAKGEEGQA